MKMYIIYFQNIEFFKEVYIVCSQPLILDTASEMMFTQCVVGPSSLRDEVYQCATSPF